MSQVSGNFAEETLESSFPPAGLPSERRFGLTFGAIGFVGSGLLAFYGAGSLAVVIVALSCAFVGAALLKPLSLKKLNQWWFNLGIILGRVVNPLVMGILFFGVITPVAIVGRIVGRDVLKLTLDARAKSYWISRDPPGPEPDSFKNQF